MKCPTRWCRRQCRPKGKECSKCSLRRWRKENPEKAKLAILRDRAKRKNLDFDLDLEWLIEFMRVNNYDPAVHHIDRISVIGGYVKGNLQVLLAADNIAKGNRERWGQAYCF